MKMVAITQRVSVDPRGERRDCLDQNWTGFLHACGLVPIPLANSASAARSICRAIPLAGIVLSGGDDLVPYGGSAPERDATEHALIELAGEQGMPLLGICRGMQAIQHRFGIELMPVSDHVTHSQRIRVDGELAEVNSYHRLGARATRDPLEVWATAEDGVIEAVRHRSRPLLGIMWHPERRSPYAQSDLALFSSFFGEG
jgi:N5-(cytidine 5'-diphosphoramidyl)-L-glutamine hydrolase